MVEAVPMVLQCPAEGAEASAVSKNCSSSISPAASLLRLFQTAIPEPTSSPSNQPSSIGPPESTMAAMANPEEGRMAAGAGFAEPVGTTNAQAKYPAESSANPQ